MDASNTQVEYDVAIIGAGLIGSAAAKYASEDVKTSVLIGPNQPQNGIYSAWFDEGRIVEKLDTHNSNWIHLGNCNKKSTQFYTVSRRKNDLLCF